MALISLRQLLDHAAENTGSKTFTATLGSFFKAKVQLDQYVPSNWELSHSENAPNALDRFPCQLMSVDKAWKKINTDFLKRDQNQGLHFSPKRVF